jgi:NADP-dependent 3-hydroxy acid dehydrogenase YdfG
MSMVLTGRRRGPLEGVAGRIVELGGQVLVRPAEVGCSEAVAAVAESIRGAFGRPDLLVNNAGLNIADRSWRG